MSAAAPSEGKKSGPKVAVKDKVRSKQKVKAQDKEKYEVNWRVLLHNDDINTFEYVTRVLTEVG